MSYYLKLRFSIWKYTFNSFGTLFYTKKIIGIRPNVQHLNSDNKLVI